MGALPVGALHRLIELSITEREVKELKALSPTGAFFGALRPAGALRYRMELSSAHVSSPTRRAPPLRSSPILSPGALQHP
jgi:hypothetical protein